MPTTSSRGRHVGGVNFTYGDGSVRYLRQATNQLGLRVSEQGLRQALAGEVVGSEADRRALADLLHLMADRSIIAILIGLLLPAVQKVREAASR